MITTSTRAKTETDLQRVSGSTLMSPAPLLLSLPNRKEVQACWELCRLHNNIGFWVVWLPTGERFTSSSLLETFLLTHACFNSLLAWSIAMVYHAQPSISAITALTRAAEYVPLCFGIKSLASLSYHREQNFMPVLTWHSV